MPLPGGAVRNAIRLALTGTALVLACVGLAVCCVMDWATRRE